MSRILSSSGKQTPLRLLAFVGAGMILLLWPLLAYPEDDLEKTELVMSPGMSITVTTSGGTMTITAVDRLTRSYTWEGATRSVEMDPRRQRWHGSLGIYYPGPGDHWQEHNGITRGVLEEGQQHFKTVDEALDWIRARKWLPVVYRDDGLVVGWSKTLPRRQLNAEVWQIYIDGKKPERLPGSQNDKIVVTYPKESPYAPLFAAVRANHLRVVKALLDGGSDPDSKDESGQPVLVMAVNYGYAPIVQLLLDKGADPNARSFDTYTALRKATQKGHIEIVKILVAKGADVNAAVERGLMKGSTPLMSAVMDENTAMVQVLLDAGANVNAQDSQGETALHSAAFHAYNAIAELLITRGATVDSRAWVGATPLIAAAGEGQLEMVKLLVAHGADVNARPDKMRSLYEYLSIFGPAETQRKIRQSGRLKVPREDGETPLHLAASWGYTAIAEFLINNESLVDARGWAGETPLMIAAARGHLEIVKLLVAHGANVNARSDGSRNAYLRACAVGDTEKMAEIEESGKLNVRSEDGVSVLRCAKSGKNTEIIQLLEQAGAKD